VEPALAFFRQSLERRAFYQCGRKTVSEVRCLVSVLRVSPEAEEELVWFFTEAEVAVATPSNFALVADMALSGRKRSAPGADSTADDRVEALHAAETIRRRLQSLPDADVDTIVALYTPDIWPPAFERYFGELAGLVARSRVAMRELADARLRGAASTRSVAQWLADRIARGDEAGLDALRVEAERARGVAMRAYDRARGRGPSVVPEEATR
jgi:hypothetical protein